MQYLTKAIVTLDKDSNRVYHLQNCVIWHNQKATPLRSPAMYAYIVDHKIHIIEYKLQKGLKEMYISKEIDSSKNYEIRKV